MPTNNVTVNVSSLHKLVCTAQPVNPFTLIKECKALYLSVKAIGIQNTNVVYYIGSDRTNETRMPAIELSEYERGIADLVVRLYYRFTDYATGRLEHHFGITTPLNILLVDLDFFDPKFVAEASKFFTVQDLVNTLVKIGPHRG